jgi:hypothetical protein
MTQTHQPATFLFINKDATDAQSGSLSRSQRDTSSINRQAQRWTASRTRKRRVVALQSQSASTKKIAQLGWQKREADTEEGPVSGTPTADTPSPEIVPRNQLQLYSANFSEGGAVDPFASTPARLDKEVHKLLQYYMSYSILTAFKGEVVGKDHLLQTPGTLPGAIVHRSFTSEVHYYALLTATAAHMNRIAVAGQQLENRYMAPAIRSLRLFLGSLDTQKSIDPQIVLDVLFLSNAERCRQNDDVALTHLRVLQQLTKLLNLSLAFDRYVYEMVCDPDVFLAVETASPPIFALSRDPGVISSSRKTLIDHEINLALSRRPVDARRGFLGAETWQSAKFKQCMGGGFIDSLDAGLFSTEMRSIISDLVQMLDMAMYSSICPSATEADAVWVHKKTTALAHRLLSVEVVGRSAREHNHSAGTVENHVISLTHRQEECCRLALIILLTYLPSTVARHSVNMNTVRLQMAFSVLDLSWGSILADEVLLWILVTGLFVALDQPEEEWFVSNAVQVASQLGIHDFTGLHKFMWRYFHRPHAAHEVCLHRLAARLRSNSENSQLSVIEGMSSNEQLALPLRSSSREHSPLP